jgi:hypothetical protein
MFLLPKFLAIMKHRFHVLSSWVRVGGLLRVNCALCPTVLGLRSFSVVHFEGHNPYPVWHLEHAETIEIFTLRTERHPHKLFGTFTIFQWCYSPNLHEVCWYVDPFWDSDARVKTRYTKHIHSKQHRITPGLGWLDRLYHTSVQLETPVAETYSSLYFNIVATNNGLVNWTVRGPDRNKTLTLYATYFQLIAHWNLWSSG